jgi:hypothetical protein
MNIEQYDLGLNYYVEYPGRIAAITRRRFSPRRRSFPRPLAIAVAGRRRAERRNDALRGRPDRGRAD